MTQWNSINDVLDFAIQGEERAAAFYQKLAAEAESGDMREVFEGFAREEQGHRAKLLAIRQGDMAMPKPHQVQDLKIADYLVDVELDGDLDYKDALTVAMKREKAAFRLYSDLAARAEDDGVRQTFQALAQEEAKHKLRFEIEYDDNILAEN
jgi:rubrerythrin